MKKFKVTLRGENFLMKVEGTAQRLGFYTARCLEDEAEKRAVESFRKDERLLEGLLNDQPDPPMLFAEEIEEISSIEIGEMNLRAMPSFKTTRRRQTNAFRNGSHPHTPDRPFGNIGGAVRKRSVAPYFCRIFWPFAPLSPTRARRFRCDMHFAMRSILSSFSAGSRFS